MALVSEKIRTFTMHASCGIRSLWCYGPGQHLVRLDDNITPGVFTMRTPTSQDHGVTWSDVEPDDHHVATFLPNGPLSALPDGSLIGGWGFGHPGDPYDPAYTFIAVTEDGGVTWTSRVTSGTFASLEPDAVDIYGLTQVSETEWLAYGLITVAAGPVRFHFMRSVDGGLTFTPFSGIGTPSSISSVTDALAVGNGVVLASGNFLGLGDLWRSTDGGVSWTGITLPVGTDPSAFVGVTSFSLLGPGVVLVGGQMEAGDPVNTNHLEPVLWRSTDSGATWTLIRLADHGPITFDAGPPTLQQYTVHSFASCQRVGVVVLAVGCITKSPFNGQMFWYSTDVGVNWTPGVYAGTPPSNDLTQIAQMVIADDGSILTAINAFTGVTHTMEVWRSVLDGFDGPGNCNGCPLLSAATMGVRLDCVPILSPPVCPPVCPTDPLSPEARLVFPSDGTGGGYRSALFVLGLAEGTGLPAQGVAVLGLPTVCGATFANNNCAVAGA
jgi:hypothetical protein